MAPRGGKLTAGTGRRGGQAFRVDVRIDGVEKTAEEFKQISRGINARLRDAMVEAGERSVLPEMKSGLPARWGETLYVKRDRGGVFIVSRLRGSMNRALGWFDFGGRRPRDHQRRHGQFVIVRTLQRERPAIDEAILSQLRKAFSEFETHF